MKREKTLFVPVKDAFSRLYMSFCVGNYVSHNISGCDAATMLLRCDTKIIIL